MSSRAPMATAWIVVLLLWLTPAVVVAEGGPGELVQQGNKAFAEGRYEAALELYTAAQVEDPLDPVIEYDIGTALYRLERFEQAQQAFDAARSLMEASETGRTEARLDLARDGAYNEGNSLFRSEHYQQAVDLYTRALELDPSDKQAKHNLELARRIMQEQTQPRAGRPKPEARQRADSSGQPDQPPGSEPEPTPVPPRPQPAPDPAPDRSRSQQPQGQRPRMSREQADRLLDALEQAEKDARRKRVKNSPESTAAVDW